MKLYLIDPSNKSVSEVEWDGDYGTLKDHIKVSYFDIATVSRNGDHILVDDEGLINGAWKSVGMFAYWVGHGEYRFLAGRGLFCGGDSEGNTVIPKTDIETVKRCVSFGQPVNMGGRMVFVCDDGNLLIMED